MAPIKKFEQYIQMAKKYDVAYFEFDGMKVVFKDKGLPETFDLSKIGGTEPVEEVQESDGPYSNATFMDGRAPEFTVE